MCVHSLLRGGSGIVPGLLPLMLPLQATCGRGDAFSRYPPLNTLCAIKTTQQHSNPKEPDHGPCAPVKQNNKTVS